MEDVGRMRDRVIDLQKHFGLAAQDVDKLLVSSDKIAKRGHRIEQLDLPEPQVRSLDSKERRPRLVAEN
jgi:DNA recombination protein RmuC